MNQVDMSSTFFVVSNVLDCGLSLPSSNLGTVPSFSVI